MDIIFADRLTELDGGVFALLAAVVLAASSGNGWREGERGMKSPRGNNHGELLTEAVAPPCAPYESRCVAK